MRGRRWFPLVAKADGVRGTARVEVSPGPFSGLLASPRKRPAIAVNRGAGRSGRADRVNALSGWVQLDNHGLTALKGVRSLAPPGGYGGLGGGATQGQPLWGDRPRHRSVLG
jgi:hypothetical protein